MLIVLLLIGLGVLGFMFYEDYRYRGIQWWLFLALAAFSFAYSYFKLQSFSFIYSIPWSILLAILLLATVLGLFWLKSRIPIKNALGLGDVLFMLAITPLFTTLDFILFLSLSFMGAAILHILFQLFKKSETVPLAGYQGLILAVYLVLDYIKPISLMNELNYLALL